MAYDELGQYIDENDPAMRLAMARMANRSAPSPLPGERVQHLQAPRGGLITGLNRVLEPVEKAANIVGSFYGMGGVGTAATGALGGGTGGRLGGQRDAAGNLVQTGKLLPF